MKAIKSLIFLSLIISFKSITYAQNGPGDQSLVPPAPNTASLLKYAEIPVSKYTGVPDISVPLYVVKSGSLTLPISLTYHASGIKASEDASWVGLGWALNCGGVIGRSIRGKDDFGGTGPGYPGSPALPGIAGFDDWIPNLGYSDPTYEAYSGILSGNYDGEPDLFYFNFGGYSGKFYIGKQTLSGNTYATQLDEKSNLKIQVLYDQQRFVITDGNGIQYYFGTAEYSYSESTPQYASLYLANLGGTNPPLTGINCPDGRVISSWYLDSIAAPSGDRIKFSYNQAGQCAGVTAPANLNEIHYVKTSGITQNGVFTTGGVNGNYDYYNYSMSMTEEVRLTGIIFNEGHVDFYTSARSDIASYGGYTPQKLDSVLVQSNNVTLPVNKFKFNYGYFDPTSTNTIGLRLKLTGVNVEDKPYSFVYNESVSLPGKDTKQVDHWGYFNSAFTNSSLVPQTYFASDQTIMSGGANREADSVYAKLGTLTEIHYPTGGKTRFDYELNDFAWRTPIKKTIDIEAVTGPPGTTDNTPVVYQDFYMPFVGDIIMTGGSLSSMTYNQLDPPPDSGDAYATLASITDSAAVDSHVFNDLFYDNNWEYGDGNNNVYSYPLTPLIISNVQPGWYRITAYANYPEMTTGVGVTYVSGYKNEEQGGGLRVKRITTIDSLRNVSMVNRYVYRNTDSPFVSSGIIMSIPQYLTGITIPPLMPGDGVYGGSYNLIQSKSNVPLNTAAQGAYVGYSIVSELYGENGENGKKVSYFGNSAEPVLHLSVPPNEDIYNGLLEKELTYTRFGTLLKKSEYTYVPYLPATKFMNGATFMAPPFLINISQYWGQSVETSAGDFILSPPGPVDGTSAYYLVDDYSIPCMWYQLKNTIVTNYNTNGAIADTTFYSYNPLSKQVSNEWSRLSDNTTITKKYKYATDYTSSAGSVYLAMVNANMLNMPIETQTWHEVGTNDLLIGSTTTQFNSFAGGKFIAPYRAYQSKMLSPLLSATVGETSTSSEPYNNLLFNTNYFDLKKELNYDNYGNTISEIFDNQRNIAYQWAYNHEYPIAECKNASNTEFYYEGFEESTASGLQTNGGHTGHNYIVGAYTVNWTPPNSRSYVISYWYRTGGVWTYQTEQTYSGTSFTLAGGDAYDDIRVYPKDSELTTYTYDPLIGMTSSTDAKGQTTYYEYDSFQRLMNIRDKDGNLLKHNDYHYQNQ